MNKHFLPLTTVALFAFSASVYAIQNDPINRSVQETKQRLSQLQQDSQQHWLQQHQFKSEQNEEAKTEDLSQLCLPYSQVKFEGFTLIDPAPFAPVVNECLNEARLNQLQQAISNAYLEKGYIHNPLKFEDNGSGVLVLRVNEGRIVKLSGERRSINPHQILPNAIGKPVKIQNLDQALDQANRVQGNDVSVDVLPAQNGEVELAFHNNETSHWQAMLGLDNNASSNYNRWQLKGGLNVGNIFNLSDSLYINVSHSLHSAHKYSRSALLYYSLPYGYWTFNGFASVSQFSLPISLQNFQVTQSGRTLQWGLSSDYVVHRGANHISTLSAQFERIDSKNRFADAILELQSPRLNSLRLSLNHLQLFENAHLGLDLSLENGWNQAVNQPENHYSKWSAEAQFSRYQLIDSQLFQHRHTLSGQYSHNYLPAVKQDDLLGRYRVRGFNDVTLSAEKNLVLQNSIAWIKEIEQWQLSPYLLFDVGIQKQVLVDSHSDKALGYGIGLQANHPRWNIVVEWATGRLFKANEAITEEHSIFTSVSHKF